MGGGTGASGRRLLALRQRMAEGDPDGRARAEVVRLLCDLGNTGAALEEAAILVGESGGSPASLMVLGDARCRAGRWREALASFSGAAEARRAAGMAAEAARTMLGPVYRLAEALGEYRLCLEAASGGGELASVLGPRASRLSGRQVPLGEQAPLERTARGIWELERAIRGMPPLALPGIVLEWGTSEPEWRWRVFAEGALLYRERSLDPRRWRKCSELLDSAVLDPRFAVERRKVRTAIAARPRNGPSDPA